MIFHIVIYSILSLYLRIYLYLEESKVKLYVIPVSANKFVNVLLCSECRWRSYGDIEVS